MTVNEHAQQHSSPPCTAEELRAAAQELRRNHLCVGMCNALKRVRVAAGKTLRPLGTCWDLQVTHEYFGLKWDVLHSGYLQSLPPPASPAGQDARVARLNMLADMVDALPAATNQTPKPKGSA